MTEISQEHAGVAIPVPRRRVGQGAERCYVRFAAIGDGGIRHVLASGLRSWPALLAAQVASTHDMSWCDASTKKATAYDVRRVQLRIAVAHRPHLVALDVGAAGGRWSGADLAEIAGHLEHCCRVLSARAAVVVTTHSGTGSRRRSGLAELDGVYEDLARQFGHIHLDRSAGMAPFVEQFAAAAALRGVPVRRDWRRR